MKLSFIIRELKNLPLILQEFNFMNKDLYKEEDITQLIEDFSIDKIKKEMTECGPESDGDEIDEAIQLIIEKLVSLGYERESATEATFDAIHNLMLREELDDTPDVLAESSAKQFWVSEFYSKIYSELERIGIELEE